MLKAYRRLILKRRIRKAKALLAKIDAGCRRVGMPRWKRKQMWSDFVKHESLHSTIFEIMEVK